MTRSDKVVKYMEDWAGGFRHTRRVDPTGLVEDLAGEVVAWNDLPDSPGNLRAYSQTINDMIGAQELKFYQIEGGTWAFELPDRYFGER